MLATISQYLSAACRALLLGLIRTYRYLLSPWIGHQCRHFPSCSLYAMEAIETLGPARGSWLTFKRLCKCHPLHPGGYDPVPTPEQIHSS